MALALAGATRPNWVLSIHHSTYAFYREPIRELVSTSVRKRYWLLIADGAKAVFD